MADYREHYQEIRATGTGLVAISVDAPSQSEGLRRELRLPFELLCDPERHVVRAWGVYNARERGGIAKPAVFVLDRDRTVRYRSGDSLATRVPAAEIVRVLRTPAADAPRRRTSIPRPSDVLRGIRNNIRFYRKR